MLSLPPRQRAVTVLRYYEDLTEAEIAETLAMAPGTVKSHSHAARAAAGRSARRTRRRTRHFPHRRRRHEPSPAAGPSRSPGRGRASSSPRWTSTPYALEPAEPGSDGCPGDRRRSRGRRGGRHHCGQRSRRELTEPTGRPGLAVDLRVAVDETALDEPSWEAFASTRYDVTVGHPPDWTEEPATRDWTWESDVRDHLSPAHEAFLSQNGHVRVSVWTAPLDASTRQESIPYLLEWVEDYCEESGNSPCTGIADRAVGLCLEAWDCHPGLLVPFENDVQAFFSGGIYAQDAMTVVAVWRPSPHGTWRATAAHGDCSRRSCPR